MISRGTRFGVLFVVAVLVALMLSVGVASAVPSYPADAYDTVDDNPGGATDISAQLAATGAGSAPYTTVRSLSEARSATPTHDPDWFKFGVSQSMVDAEYSFLLEAIPLTDPLVDPVIEVYGPVSIPSSVVYSFADSYAPGAIDKFAIDGNCWGPWYSDALQAMTTRRGASLVFRPTAPGTYYVRVRPYGDNSGNNYFDQAGQYTLRAKVSVATRVAGTNRIGTAVEISRERFSDNQLDGTLMGNNLSAAIVVNGYVFPDALSASSLAGVIQGPILLAEQNALPALTAAELKRLNPDTVYVVGGPAAVSDGVIADIKALFPSADPVKVERVAGSNRIATSVAVADKALGLSSQTPVTPKGFAFIANAYNFPDALSASSMAAGDLVPILLTGGAALDSRVDTAITARGIKDVIIVGGPAAISPAVETALKTKLAVALTCSGLPVRTATRHPRSSRRGRRASRVAATSVRRAVPTRSMPPILGASACARARTSPMPWPQGHSVAMTGTGIPSHFCSPRATSSRSGSWTSTAEDLLRVRPATSTTYGAWVARRRWIGRTSSAARPR